jgi:hypothetical protein
MKSALARDMADKMKELKRDVETTLLQNVAYVSGGDTTARKMAGLSCYIKTNIDKASDGTACGWYWRGHLHDRHGPRLAEASVEAALATGMVQRRHAFAGLPERLPEAQVRHVLRCLRPRRATATSAR